MSTSSSYAESNPTSGSQHDGISSVFYEGTTRNKRYGGLVARLQQKNILPKATCALLDALNIYMEVICGDEHVETKLHCCIHEPLEDIISGRLEPVAYQQFILKMVVMSEAIIELFFPFVTYSHAKLYYKQIIRFRQILDNAIAYLDPNRPTRNPNSHPNTDHTDILSDSDDSLIIFNGHQAKAEQLIYPADYKLWPDLTKIYLEVRLAPANAPVSLDIASGYYANAYRLISKSSCHRSFPPEDLSMMYSDMPSSDMASDMAFFHQDIRSALCGDSEMADNSMDLTTSSCATANTSSSTTASSSATTNHPNTSVSEESTTDASNVDTSTSAEDAAAAAALPTSTTTLGTQTEATEMACDEYILSEKAFRFTIFPIMHRDLWDLYGKAQASFWTVHEIDLSKDMHDFEKLNANEQQYIKYVLAFFAASDTLVNMNLLENVIQSVKLPEANFFYVFQMAIENIHSETYSILIDTYIKNTIEKQNLFNSIETMPTIKSKAEWVLQYIDNKQLTFAERIIAFVAVEGIFFSSSFASIFWLKKRGIMPGLTFSNELISRDEGLHCEFAVLVYNNYIQNKLPEAKVQAIIQSAVELESTFVEDVLPVSLIGMNNTEMKKYVRFVADYWLQQLYIEPIYNVANPFDFMQNISLDGKTNFFEKKVAEYQKYGISTGHSILGDTSEFTIDEDF